MSGLSSYAVRMARLSAQIFGEVVNPADSRSLKVVQLFQELPLAKRKERRTRRLQGGDLRLRKLRGKGKPKKGEGKRATKKK
ncbi:unnamed protein product [Tetraodon nigroviridis]|uniref:Small ribosomal subunit protein mS33 n=1 Tax=Tetraodon nigroviridis TaxID=99883 RepID=Q4SRI4_TETNG|nr:unnamed protein product [Tetraodon nigroviridis]